MTIGWHVPRISIIINNSLNRVVYTDLDVDISLLKRGKRQLRRELLQLQLFKMGMITILQGDECGSLKIIKMGT